MVERLPQARLAPLFLVSLAAIAFEILLTRYFAIANWSEYGYWVISITMVGFSVSGVVLSLCKDWFVRRSGGLLFITPLLLMVFACAGYYLVTVNPFNPLEFQNRDLWLDQLLNIWKYYAALFPFFFLAGLYVGLYFVAFQEQIPRSYAADLTGAGAGALLILALMFWLHPFDLLAAVFPFLVLATLMQLPDALRHRRVPVYAAALALLAACELITFGFIRADFNEYKAIYPPLHVDGNRIVDEIRSPRGYFLVLDNFTERLDIDLSNNFSVLGAAGPPATYGLYTDGNRITSLPKKLDYDVSYVTAALDTFPFELKPAPRSLLIGTRGGFRIREVLGLGAAKVTALEPDPSVFRLIQDGAEPALRDPRVTLTRDSPALLATWAAGGYDIVDIASDFLSQADANKFAFTREAVRAYLHVLKDDGVASIQVSMREFTVYTVKMLETVRQALIEHGVRDPARHVIVYRSSWNARILVSKRPFSPEQVQTLREFCERRSFDTSYYPGIDPARVAVWNDLPLVSFEHETILSGTDRANDALSDEALRIFAEDNLEFVNGHFFNLAPSTYDRPFFYSVLHLSQLGGILKKIALIPREEIGYLINLAVLAQALVLAAVVLGLPLVGRRAGKPGAGVLVETVFYFAGLGLGFLFLEIYLIEKVSFYLNDRTYAFAAVLSAMLMFSGFGSFYAGRYLERPRRGIAVACSAALVWIVLAYLFLDEALLATLGLSFALKCMLTALIIAPLAFALGIPFPLGLYQFRGTRSNFLPWAWSLNGAFSVISTPLANLLAVAAGYKMVLVLSLLLYVIVFLAFPPAQDSNQPNPR
ncbi:MAG: hypothetical protein HY942_02215 [Gammaproteobacteria bacterium]|nr:hypothetical protein [Gammaproteobacteria bacterium]